MYDVLIIGCGISGAAAAFELSKYRLKVAVLEKENDVSTGTTKANSAILHAGYD
ncbi:FAD-dependent oxidoreductase, partial [Bacteroides thetaiotaomicron]